MRPQRSDLISKFLNLDLKLNLKLILPYLKTHKNNVTSLQVQYLPFPLNMYALCVFGWERSLVAIANIEVVHFLLHYKPRSSAVFSFNQKDREEQQRKKRCFKRRRRQKEEEM